MLTLLITWCFAPPIVRLRKDQHSKLEVEFPLNAYHYHTIVKSESPKLNHRKSGTVCANSMACPPLDAGLPNPFFSTAHASTSLKTQLIKLPLNFDSCHYARFAPWNFSHILSIVRPTRISCLLPHEQDKISKMPVFANVRVLTWDRGQALLSCHGFPPLGRSYLASLTS